MDLVTQACLGAAMGELVLGRALGARAAAYGAGLGLLPDADALLRPFLDDLRVLTWHRHVSHSALGCLLAAPLLGWLLQRRHPQLSRARWTLLAFLALGTHVLLDCCTTWGTQVGQPFSDAPVAFCSVSVIDPLVTLPLLVSVLVCLRLPREGSARAWCARVGVALAGLYLLALGGVKLHMEGELRATLAREGLQVRRVFSKPTLGNGLLWRLVAEHPGGFWVGYRSLLDAAAGVEQVRTVPQPGELLAPLAGDPVLARMRRVMDGWLGASRDAEGRIVLQDLRYGQWRGWTREETPYVFAYRLHPEAGGTRLETLPRIRPGPELRRSFLARIRGR